GAYLGSVAKALTASADGNSRTAIKVVSRGLPSSVFTFPLRDRYLPPCLCTMSCTEAAYAGTHPSSVTLMSAITYTVIVFISCSRSKKNPVGPTPQSCTQWRHTGVIGHRRCEVAPFIRSPRRRGPKHNLLEAISNTEAQPPPDDDAHNLDT